MKHSWNGNWLLTNSIVFRLQRHSDHHAHASRPYQVRLHLLRFLTLKTSLQIPNKHKTAPTWYARPHPFDALSFRCRSFGYGGMRRCRSFACNGQYFPVWNAALKSLMISCLRSYQAHLQQPTDQHMLLICMKISLCLNGSEVWNSHLLAADRRALPSHLVWCQSQCAAVTATDQAAPE